MKISVVIPVYNEQKIIKRCLNSLMNQEVKPDEIIVVDNNCTDNTIKIAKKFPRLKIINEKKQGITHARNTGFNIARGDILARCDADTIVPPNWIKRLKLDFSRRKIAGVTTKFRLFDSDLVKDTLFISDLYDYFSNLILNSPSFMGPAMAISKKSWLKVKNKICTDDSEVHEDLDLTIHILKYGKIFLDKSVVVSISSRRMRNNPLSYFVEYPSRLVKMLKSHRHFLQF